METGNLSSEQPSENREFYFDLSYETGKIAGDGFGYNIVVTLSEKIDCNFLSNVILDSVKDAIERIKTEGAGSVTREEKTTKRSVLSNPVMDVSDPK